MAEIATARAAIAEARGVATIAAETSRVRHVPAPTTARVVIVAAGRKEGVEIAIVHGASVREEIVPVATGLAETARRGIVRAETARREIAHAATVPAATDLVATGREEIVPAETVRREIALVVTGRVETGRVATGRAAIVRMASAREEIVHAATVRREIFRKATVHAEKDAVTTSVVATVRAERIVASDAPTTSSVVRDRSARATNETIPRRHLGDPIASRWGMAAQSRGEIGPIATSSLVLHVRRLRDRKLHARSLQRPHHRSIRR